MLLVVGEANMKIVLMLSAAHEPMIDYPSIYIEGESIVFNGFEYDLSVIPEGGEVEAEFPAAGIIKRVEGVINISLVYQYHSGKAELNQSTDINDFTFDIEEGHVPCPIIWKPIVEETIDV